MKTGTDVLLPTSPAFLRLQARSRGERGGFVFRGRRIPFGEMAAAVDGLTAWLVRHGIGAGDPVGVMAANEPAMVAMTYAVWGAGAITVPLAARSTAEEMSRLLVHARARGLLCDALRTDVAQDAARAAGIPAWACEADLPLKPRVVVRAARRAAGRPAVPRPDQRAAIAYTSGTTGAPKGVVITHANIWWAGQACGRARGDVADGVGSCISPLTHTPVFISHLLCRVLSGATAVLLEKFSTDAVLEAVERNGITEISVIGGMVFDIIAMGSVPASVRRTVGKVTVGGAPTRMEAKRKLADMFDGAEVIEAYGQTESTDGVTMARGRSVFEREGTVGCPNPYVIVRIRRRDGTLAKPGEEGEIVVGGPTVMVGYHRDPRATALAIREGWLHTGDLGRQDADGWLWLTGRVKDLIITGGENVAPGEVEEVLRAHPDVADVAVIGTPHAKWGEQVTAIVVRKPGAAIDGEALGVFVGTRLAGFKRPRRFEFVATLPRNAANKVATGVLKEQFK